MSILTITIFCLLAMNCGNKSNSPTIIPVDSELQVRLTATQEKEGTIIPTDSSAIEETVRITELLRYPDNGDSITVAFNLKDINKYADFTEQNIGKRIAIYANGRIVSMPLVKMKLGNGACSFLISKEEALRLFPKAQIE